MATTKGDVLNFVEKVKDKALRAVNEKWATQLDQAWQEYLDQKPDLKVFIAGLAETERQHEKILKWLRLLAGGNFVSGAYFYNKDSAKYTIAEIKGEVLKYEKENTFAQVVSQRKKEYEETRGAYYKIKCRMERMRSVKKMVEELQSLGFDCSWLKDPDTGINKEALFPCKEKGL